MRKQIRNYLSRIKGSRVKIQSSIRSCRHVRTTSSESAAPETKQNDAAAATVLNIDQFLSQDFRSLYGDEDEDDEFQASTPKTTPFLFDASLPRENPPLENLYRSERFFVVTGSSSSRIVDEASSSSANCQSVGGGKPAKDDFVALSTRSPMPYEDFRRSMQEMVDARAEQNGNVNWDFLEELLFSYMDLNDKKSHKDILRAFVDLIVALRENSGQPSPAIRPPLAATLGGSGSI